MNIIAFNFGSTDPLYLFQSNLEILDHSVCISVGVLYAFSYFECLHTLVTANYLIVTETIL